MLSLILLLCFLPHGSAQEKQPKPFPPCETKQPLYTGQDNKPIVLTSRQLKQQAVHCEVPKMSSMLGQARFAGQVQLALLVDLKGDVECVRVISGHPLVNGVAIDAAKEWKFKPLNRKGKVLAFCGVLTFHITTGSADHAPDRCLCAHW
jgi:outer membrane biosynthesis protein TonB